MGRKILKITFSHLERVLDMVSPSSPPSGNPSVHRSPETHKSQRVIKTIKSEMTIDETHLNHHERTEFSFGRSTQKNHISQISTEIEKPRLLDPKPLVGWNIFIWLKWSGDTIFKISTFYLTALFGALSAPLVLASCPLLFNWISTMCIATSHSNAKFFLKLRPGWVPSAHRWNSRPQLIFNWDLNSNFCPWDTH